ncbi:hypothetical protein CBM2633_B10041 [Cupriavidus taiwanensis]|nr:hypothetical protein CBM2633_B10041 [Cupriavidus taiwanensis]
MRAGLSQAIQGRTYELRAHPHALISRHDRYRTKSVPLRIAIGDVDGGNGDMADNLARQFRDKRDLQLSRRPQGRDDKLFRATGVGSDGEGRLCHLGNGVCVVRTLAPDQDRIKLGHSVS